MLTLAGVLPLSVPLTVCVRRRGRPRLALAGSAPRHGSVSVNSSRWQLPVIALVSAGTAASVVPARMGENETGRDIRRNVS